MEADEQQHMRELVDELASDPGYATGKRKFPRPVTTTEAATISEGLQAEVDNGVRGREAAATAEGMTMACHRGCNGCCEEPIMVFRGEAVLVAQWLKQPENSGVRDAFVAAYPEWKRRVGSFPARLSELSATDPAGYRREHVRGWQLGVLCPFNHGGDCTIYPVRPIVCRNGHAIGTSERCTGASPEPATRLNFVPLDQFIARTRSLLAAAHNAIGGPRGKVEALPNIVHHLMRPRR